MIISNLVLFYIYTYLIYHLLSLYGWAGLTAEVVVGRIG